MTYEEVRMRAQRHLDEEPLGHPDYRWRLSEGVELPDGWYFDYVFEPVRAVPEAESEQFAGATGYIVPSDGSEVRAISWDEYAERELSRAQPSD